ncbi:hypothetical protein [Desulfotignum balticum]|uniref:hypothetical protein n=1 Tax=Desulfotignum balticum TaxID=115781 RepID=UPI0004627A5C|nr:hypothetical protein [Desulfotignum balticum]
MTPQETIKYCLHGYHQATRESNDLNGHLYDRRYHYGRARAFLEVLEAVASAAGITEEQIHKNQRQVIKERHESGADR